VKRALVMSSGGAARSERRVRHKSPSRPLRGRTERLIWSVFPLPPLSDRHQDGASDGFRSSNFPGNTSPGLFSLCGRVDRIYRPLRGMLFSVCGCHAL